MTKRKWPNHDLYENVEHVYHPHWPNWRGIVKTVHGPFALCKTDVEYGVYWKDEVVFQYADLRPEPEEYEGAH